LGEKKDAFLAEKKSDKREGGEKSWRGGVR